MTSWFVRFSCLALAGAAGLAPMLACSSSSETPVTTCERESVDRFKELEVVDESVVGDDRSKNELDGAWSFRHAIENMAPVGADAGAFVQSWLVNWVTVTEVNGFPTDRPSEGRSATMRSKIICPWLKATAANACNDDCSSCATEKLDLARSPFRLIGIVNRLDQRNEVASEPNGEARLVFALTSGPADDPASAPMPMSVIFEYLPPTTRSPREWAATWHALGKHGAFDDAYRAELQAITDTFVARGADPTAVNGSAIGQVRTNESALDWIWQQREFGLNGSGALELRPVRNTPGEALNGTATLTSYLLANRDAIIANRFELPETLRAGSADQLQYVWTVPNVDEPLRNAFAGNTCNGCHSSEHPNIDTAFHLSPFRKGTDRLSPFLYSRTGAPDELTRRGQVNAAIRCVE